LSKTSGRFWGFKPLTNSGILVLLQIHAYEAGGEGRRRLWSIGREQGDGMEADCLLADYLLLLSESRCMM
jgi:hypothetical protein